MILEDKKITVVGLGKSGLACARFLTRRGARVTVTDRAAESDLAAQALALDRMGAAAVLGRHEPADFENADLIVISPGVPHTIAPVKRAVSKGIPVVGEIELASRFIREPIIAVTGTNGKTTTTELLGRMLSDSGIQTFVGGNIGTPLITYVDKGSHADWLVVEVSSFQLDTVRRFKPAVAVLLNITADHLDRYADFEAYAESKALILANQQADDVAILNNGDPWVRAAGRRAKGTRLFFNTTNRRDEGAWVDGDQIHIRLPRLEPVKADTPVETAFDLSRFRPAGSHNRENAAAACLAAMAAGATAEGIQRALNAFKGLAHRLAHVATIGGVDYYDDSKATNTDASARAVETFTQPVVLILGGQDKGGDWQGLAGRISPRIKKLIVMGEAQDRILKELAPVVPTETAVSMTDAVRLAAQAAQPGEAVLLAPGCASFDSYNSYAERGDDFIREVKRMRQADDRK